MPELKRRDEAPPQDKTLLWIAGVLLLIPMVALMLVPTYAKDAPKLGPFPFFIWYQMLWVFLCAGFTTTAYVLVNKARERGARTLNKDGDA